MDSDSKGITKVVQSTTRQVVSNNYKLDPGQVADCMDSRQVASECYLAKESLESQAHFFDKEYLCTIVEPRCGGCRCGKCPIPGLRYSYHEEGELKLIRDGLVHNGKC